MKSQKKITLSLILFCGILMTLTSGSIPLAAHGILVSVSQEPPRIFIKANYHGSKIAANARVVVCFEANGVETEFLTGNTDQKGLFSFLPDKPGHWNITVDDMLGHRKGVSIDLGNDFFPVVTPKESVKPEIPEAQTPQPMTDTKVKNRETPVATTVMDEQDATPKQSFTSDSSWYYLIKIVLGVLLILGITFYLSRWQKKQESQKNKEK